MVTGVGTTMPTGGVTVGATPPAQHVPQEAGQPPAQTTPAVTATRRSSENRRSNKPIMEKRRRARINNSLNDLQKLMLDAKIKDSSSRHSKLEKADVLEMAVKYIKNLQRQSIALSRSADPNDPNKFRAGFNECISEVGSFTGLDAAAKRCLQAYLTSRIGTDANGNNGQVTAQQPVQPAPPTTQLQVHILPQVDATPRIQVQQSNGIFFTNANGTGLQLLPTRLANGDIALVLPAGAKATPVTSPSLSPTPTSPLPTLIPIPQRTASTASSSSSASSTSSTSTSAASPVTFETSPASFRDQSTGYSSGNSHRDVATSPANGYTSDPEFDPRICSPPLQKPLALVMRKSVVQSTDSKPWRPW